MTAQEFIKSLATIPHFYVALSKFTRMPYVECDEETFNDKIFLFVNEDMANAFATSRQNNKQPIAIVKVMNDKMKGFFSSLVADGIDTICFMDDNTENVTMDKIITRTLKEGMNAPIENPSLQISMMYYFQNARNVDSEEDRQNVQRLEEEMMANIARAIFLVPFTQLEQKENNQAAINLLQMKTENDEIFVPIYTDMDEFFKVQPPNEPVQFLPMGFKKLTEIKFVGMNGFVLNPGSVRLTLTPQILNVVMQRFGDQSK